MSVAEAFERLEAAGLRTAEAHQEEIKARAEWARLRLIELADKFAGVGGYAFSTEWEYDDEGGYIPTVSVFVDLKGEVADVLDDDLVEVGVMLTHDAAELFGEHKTIEELKEVRF